MLDIPFVQARWFTQVDAPRRIDFVVIHDMEMPESVTTAEDCAHMFATLPSDRKASAHYAVDADSIVQCVRENDIAYHAPPNTHSLGIEHAGYARQTREQWLDDFSQRELRLSAQLMAELLQKYDLPLVFLSPADLVAGRRGITTHANVSKAWGQTTHTDPGPDFPINWYMDRVREAMAGEADMTPDEMWTELSSHDSWFVDKARQAVQAELGDENTGVFSDRVAAKVLAQLTPVAPTPTVSVDLDALAAKVADVLAARLQS